MANYQPFPPTPWNGSVRDKFGTPGPYEDAVQNTPIFEENGPENFKGVDIMRAVRSFDPCLPCGVHMYTGKGVEEGHAHAHGAGVGAGGPGDGGAGNRARPDGAGLGVHAGAGGPAAAAWRRGPDGAGRAAHRRAGGMPDSPARAVAEELVGAVLEFHGDGAGAAALDDGRSARRGHGRGGRGGGQPAAHPRPLPGGAGGAGGRGAGQRAALHGVPRGRRGLPGGGGRRGAPAAGGQLQRLRGIVGHAGAGDQEGAVARPRPTCWASRWRASRSEPTHGPPDIGGTPLPLARRRAGNGAAVPALAGWQDLDAVAGLAGRADGRAGRGGQ